MMVIEDSFPLRKVISKTTQLILVLSIFPLTVWLKINRKELGFVAKEQFFKELFRGFGLGLLTLLPVFLIEYQLGIHSIDSTKHWTFVFSIKKISLSLLLALLISLIEEPLFRGLLLSGLRKKIPIISAVMISSIYYAALHFLNSHSEIPFRQQGPFSGFELLGEAFSNLLNPEIRSAFLALFMVGIFLSLLRTRLNASLALCIGCHTAWVWQIKMSKSLFDLNDQSDYLYLVSPYDGVIGPLVTVWLMFAVLILIFYGKFKANRGVSLNSV
jgi:membrane protease YdiL (CAAX protease family)